MRTPMSLLCWSACIIGEEWNVVTFTSLLSCHVVECQYQNSLERLAPCFEFHQAIQCNNGPSNWPCHLGSPVLNSWEPRQSHWPPVPGLKLQRQTIKVLVIFNHYTQFFFFFFFKVSMPFTSDLEWIKQCEWPKILLNLIKFFLQQIYWKFSGLIIKLHFTNKKDV